MTKEEFQRLWKLNYPETIPISYLFKSDYSDRWFRIHSLPHSKRYADNDVEWKILLARQNEITTDLLDEDSTIFLVTGEYSQADKITNYITNEEEVFKSFEFTRLDSIELVQIDPEQYDKLDTYIPAFTKTLWKANYHDDILIEIAKDNIRAFFVSFDKNVIVAPYDGGVDIICADIEAKNDYRKKYSDWLSPRLDGM